MSLAEHDKYNVSIDWLFGLSDKKLQLHLKHITISFALLLIFEILNTAKAIIQKVKQHII
mgnify:FL=1